jgi:regulator of replication initiation timing
MFKLGSIYFKFAIIVSLFVLFVGVFFYYNKIRDDLSTLRANNKILIQNIKKQQTVIENMKDDVETIKKINRHITDENNKLKKDVEILRKKFDKRDFGATSSRKPKLVERLINRASENVARCFELASGASLNEKEKNAKTSKEANNECPNLVDNIINNTN